MAPDLSNDPAAVLLIRLRGLKDISGLSLSQISKRTHYSRASWDRWFNGRRLITRAALVGLADIAAADAGPLLDLLDRAAAAPPPVPSPAAVRGAARRSGGPIAQLPAAIADAPGREVETALVAAALTRGPGSPGRPSIFAVTGPAGAGKTALAVRVAHLIAPRFPDGQLYADLDASVAPRDPTTVLADWLHALGDRAEDIPASPEARSARFRSVLHNRRLLLLLDDARDDQQVWPLIPAAGGCAVLITSRGPLTRIAGPRRVDITR